MFFNFNISKYLCFLGGYSKNSKIYVVSEKSGNEKVYFITSNSLDDSVTYSFFNSSFRKGRPVRSYINRKKLFIICYNYDSDFKSKKIG